MMNGILIPAVILFWLSMVLPAWGNLPGFVCTGLVFFASAMILFDLKRFLHDAPILIFSMANIAMFLSPLFYFLARKNRLSYIFYFSFHAAIAFLFGFMLLCPEKIDLGSQVLEMNVGHYVWTFSFVLYAVGLFCPIGSQILSFFKSQRLNLLQRFRLTKAADKQDQMEKKTEPVAGSLSSDIGLNQKLLGTYSRKAGGALASVMNILRLFAYVVLVFMVFLIALVITFHLIARARFGELSTNRPINKPISKSELLSQESLRSLTSYAGKYVWIEGECGELKYLPTFLTNPDYMFSSVNKGWAFDHSDWFSTKYYYKNTFDGKKLRHIEKGGFNSFLIAAKEDWEIDFSGFPVIIAKDRLHRTECKFRHSSGIVDPRAKLRNRPFPRDVQSPSPQPDPGLRAKKFWEEFDSTPFMQFELKDNCWPPDQKIGPYDFMMRLCDFEGAELYEELLEKDARDSRAYFYRALAKIQSGKLEEAMTDVKRAKEHSPNKDSWKFKFLEEYFYHEREQYEKAADAYSSMTGYYANDSRISTVRWQALLLNIDSRLRTIDLDRFDIRLEEIKKQIDSLDWTREALCSARYSRGKLDCPAFADTVRTLKERADRVEDSFFNVEFFDRLARRKEWDQVFDLGGLWIKRFPERPEGYYYRALGFVSGSSMYQALEAWDDMNKAIALHQQAPCSYFMCRSRIALELFKKDVNERIRPGASGELTPQNLLQSAMEDYQRGSECSLTNREAVETTMRLASAALAQNNISLAQNAIFLARQNLEKVKADPSLGGDMNIPTFELYIRSLEQDVFKALGKTAERETAQ